MLLGDHFAYIHINCLIFRHLCDSDPIFQILFYNVEFFWWCFVLIQMYSRLIKYRN
uniref:Uncharacterized protein n=1 Tax=Arundo donax TaxID=35708 RepID=A0A0A8ZBU0_ARUDO